jgi:hypothetical protein
VGPGIQPIHCSILRGPQGICFRRWAGQVALNGEEHEESTLCCGDRLTLGTIELEVITDGLPVTPAVRRRTPPPREVRKAYRNRMQRLLTRVRSFREMESLLNRTQREVDALRSESTAYRAQMELHSRQAQEAESNAAAHEKLQRVEADLRALQGRWDEQQRLMVELERAICDLKSDRNQHQLELQQTEERCDSLRKSLAVAEQSIATMRTQAETSKACQERHRAELLTANQELEVLRVRIREFESKADAANDPVPAGNSPMESGVEERGPNAVEYQVRSSIDADSAPTSLSTASDPIMDLLDDRTVDEVDLPLAATDEPLEAVDQAFESELNKVSPHPGSLTTLTQDLDMEDVAKNAPVVPANSVIPKHDTDPNEEESIEDYMAWLMQRVRGEQGLKSTRETPKVVHLAPTPAPVVTPVAKPNQPPATNAATSCVTEKPGTMPSVSQRIVPDDYESNLAAMRQIAKQSAQSALATHQRNGWLQTATGKFVACGVACAASVAISYLSRGSSWQIVVAGCGFAIGIFWGAQGMQLSQSARRLGSDDATPEKGIGQNGLSDQPGNRSPATKSTDADSAKGSLDGRSCEDISAATMEQIAKL